jgi:hypothetical protein
MRSPPGKCGQCVGSAGNGPAWAWLAAAGGVLVGRSQSRWGMLAGVGLAAWACWRSCGADQDSAVQETAATEPGYIPLATDRETQVEGRGRSSLVTNALAGGSVGILDLEPMPSVLAEAGETNETAAICPLGLGEAWLGEGPLLTSEEYDEGPSLVSESEEAWLNGGAEIPDSVELPEV